jgi:hypothetical protein
MYTIYSKEDNRNGNQAEIEEEAIKQVEYFDGHND